MATLFVVGSIGFWILIVVEFILLLVLTEHEMPGAGFLSLLVVMVLLKICGNFSITDLAFSYPLGFVVCAIGYLLMGTLWSVLKWFFFVRDRRAAYLEAKANHEKDPEKEWVPDEHHRGQSSFTALPWDRSTARKRFLNSKGELAPLARDNKSRILIWMAYWPWSVIWTLIHDAVKRIWKTIYETIHKLLQNISDSTFKGVE